MRPNGQGICDTARTGPARTAFGHDHDQERKLAATDHRGRAAGRDLGAVSIPALVRPAAAGLGNGRLRSGVVPHLVRAGILARRHALALALPRLVRRIVCGLIPSAARRVGLVGRLGLLALPMWLWLTYRLTNVIDSRMPRQPQ